jgi:hypothetical protein
MRRGAGAIDHSFFTSPREGGGILSSAAVDSLSTLEPQEQREPTPTSPSHEPVTSELTAPVVAASDRCPNCGARMAPDQRYCIECGERRSGGGLREALPRAHTAAAAAPPAKRSRLTPNGTLIAGIGTLLLALGVGVLIGRTGDHSSKSAGNAPVQVVTVPTASGAATAAAGTAAAGAVKATQAKHHAKKAAAAKKSSTPASLTKQKPGSNLPPPVVKIGSPGHGKGYQNGKFTGNFFGN